ncbi:uncharacterized protein G2W53_013970 [Senna tora]|uniref:Uncharacterized protein n=1 Tax=Senna tora TaxID=362788 RepID=A0A834WR50_9FABA|nr:uncharacterized protein G2W53_013970 [Senna tora]
MSFVLLLRMGEWVRGPATLAVLVFACFSQDWAQGPTTLGFSSLLVFLQEQVWGFATLAGIQLWRFGLPLLRDFMPCGSKDQSLDMLQFGWAGLSRHLQLCQSVPPLLRAWSSIHVPLEGLFFSSSSSL